MNEKYKEEYERFKLDISIGLYDNAIIAMSSNLGRLLAFLELSTFTEMERSEEEKKLEPYIMIGKKILFKGGKINDAIQIA